MMIEPDSDKAEALRDRFVPPDHEYSVKITFAPVEADPEIPPKSHLADSVVAVAFTRSQAGIFAETITAGDVDSSGEDPKVLFDALISLAATLLKNPEAENWQKGLCGGFLQATQAVMAIPAEERNKPAVLRGASGEMAGKMMAERLGQLARSLFEAMEEAHQEEQKGGGEQPPFGRPGGPEKLL